MNENKGSLSEKSANLVSALLKEPKIFDRVTAPIKNRERYKNIMIIAEDGTIHLGKYKWHGIGAFWNNLIKCKKDISFEEFALRVWDALVDMTAGTEAAEPVLEGLGRETLMEGIRAKNWDWLVDRFFDICRHITTKGYWKTTGTPSRNNNSRRQSAQNADDEEVVVTVEQQRPTKWVKVVDALGDPFEILNVRWLGGRNSH